MKIVFDSGVLISFSETCFIDLFSKLQENLGEFIITESVKYESIDRAKNIMRFKLSSKRIESVINKSFSIFKSTPELKETTKKIMDLANSMFLVKGNYLKIIHLGEAESMALLALTNANYLAVDERTTRMLIEQPHTLVNIFKRKHNTNKIKFDEQKYLEFKKIIGNINCVRSVDFFAYACKHNLANPMYESKDIVKAVLFALKFRGCSVSFEEINKYVDGL